MARPIDTLRRMAGIDGPATLSAKITIRLSAKDAIAARLLLWLMDEYPDMTQGELDDVLDNAKFWTMYYGSIADDAVAQPPGGEE